MENEDLKEELKECDTLNQMWMKLDDYYDLDKPIGKIVRSIVVTKLLNNFDKLLIITRIPEREYEPDEETDNIP